MDKFIEKLNKNNPFFTIKKNDKTDGKGHSEQKWSIVFHTKNELINDLVKGVVIDLLDNHSRNLLQNSDVIDKYLNTYSKLYKLSESISDFDYTITEKTSTSVSIKYIQHVMNILSDIVKTKSNNQSKMDAHSQNDDYSINRCIGCGVDMGECNPRQYCCKTYCPEEQFRLQYEMEDEHNI